MSDDAQADGGEVSEQDKPSESSEAPKDPAAESAAPDAEAAAPDAAEVEAEAAPETAAPEAEAAPETAEAEAEAAPDAAEAAPEGEAESAPPLAPGDQTLHCQDCDQDFIFSAKEQEFFKSREFSSPKRCQTCRAARRERREQGGSRIRGGRRSGPRQEERQDEVPEDSGPREMHDVLCSECGIETQAPFKPTGSKPTFCADCRVPPKRMGRPS